MALTHSLNPGQVGAVGSLESLIETTRRRCGIFLPLWMSALQMNSFLPMPV